MDIEFGTDRTSKRSSPVRLCEPPTGHRIPRVSVITIFYNADRYLEEAIESVLAQDFKDLELLLVDDGSTDHSSAIALGYAKRFPQLVRYLEHSGHANRGMSASRNAGIQSAYGEFVAFIDADDVWEPSKLSDQIAILETHRELGMVCGAVRYWSSWAGYEDEIRLTGILQDQVLQPPFVSLTNYPLGSGGAPCPSDLLLRRGIFEQIGGFEEQFTGPRQMYEDQAFLAKLYLQTPIYFSSSVWLRYRQHPDSCVAKVTGDGLYQEVRLYFLRWFTEYLKTRLTPSTAPVWQSLRRARWQTQYPRISRLIRAPLRLALRLRRGARAFRE
jgi:glycosyltransferase involved in cell wall biosynthesis